MAKKTKKVLVQKEKQAQKSATQKEIAQSIWRELGYSLSIADIEAVMRVEQSTIIELLKKGYRIVKRDFITMSSNLKEGKSHVSALDGKTYQIPKRMDVRVTLGRGLKKALILEGN